MEDVVSRIIYIVELYRELNITLEEREELTGFLMEELSTFKTDIRKQTIQRVVEALEED